MDFIKKFRIKQNEHVSLHKIDPEFTGPYQSKEEAEKHFQSNLEDLRKLQTLLYAENKRALLVILQAMDAGGKDGTIRNVMFGLNPQGCRVTSFKAPSHEELEHDFLWRIHKAVPRKGEIGIFNRSQYEDVLVVRVHNIVPKSIWSKRYDMINEFEDNLLNNGVHILKFFLHISYDEQAKRIKARMKDPRKNWKLSPEDFKERQYWGDYMKAYEDALSKCSAKDAPWFVIPSNKKWFRNLVVSSIIKETLESWDMKYPKVRMDLSKVRLK